MKNHQIWLTVMVAMGAIAGSTFATAAYLNVKQSPPVAQIPSPQATVEFSPSESPITSPEESQSVTPIEDAESQSVTPIEDEEIDFSSQPSLISQQPVRPTTPAQRPPQRTQPNASEFSQFRLRLLDASQRADTNFIRAITTPQTQWNYGGTLNLDSYNIDSNQSKFWAYMDKAVTPGCSIDSQAKVANKEAGSAVWSCPDLTKVKQSIRPDRPNYGNLAILGQNVNLRSQPGAGGRVVGSVSYDYVSIDHNAYNSLPANTQEQLRADVVNGWTAVRLRNGQRGWIQNRYVYDEENDYRVSFVRTSGQWRLRYFLRGNGN